MISAESSVVIERPADEVFAFVSDCTNEPKWHTDVIEAAPAGDTPLAVGARQRWVLHFMGRREMPMQITKLEPGRLEQFQAQKAIMGMQPTITYRVEPAGTGTRFTRAVQMELQGAAKFMGGMMRSLVAKRNNQFVKNLKSVLER
jgi:uncharacterized protein YndB with AHSA1/START domain